MGQPIYGLHNTEDALQHSEQPTQRSPAEASALLGSRLLQGWRMMAESCPECAVPLMQPRHLDACYCARCDAHYPLPGSEEQQPPPEISDPAVGSSAGLRGHPLSSDVLSYPLRDALYQAADEQPEFNRPPLPPQGTDRDLPPYPLSSANVRQTQRLERNYFDEFIRVSQQRAGFVLPARPPPPRNTEPAPNGSLPLPASDPQQRSESPVLPTAVVSPPEAPSAAELQAVEPELTPADILAFQEREAERGANRQTELMRNSRSPSQEPVTNAVTNAPASESSAIEVGQSRDNIAAEVGHAARRGQAAGEVEGEAGPSGAAPIDASQAVAEKLLQGWTLLEQHCPRCLTPLVADRERRMFCPGCSLWVLPAAQVSSSREEEPPARVFREEDPPATAVGTPRTPSQRQPTSSPPGLDDTKLPPPSTTRREAEPHKSPKAAAASSPRSWPNAQATATVLARTILDKMLEVNELLQKTPATQVEECARLLKVVNDCSEALKSLQQL